MVKLLDNILGYVSESPFAEAVHDLGNRGRVEFVTISPDDAARRRFRLQN